MTTLAIDIGGTKLAAALIGADGQIRDRRELPTPASQTPEALRGRMVYGAWKHDEGSQGRGIIL